MIHPADKLFLRTMVSSAESTDGHKYELCVSVGSRLPIVRSLTSGKCFTISWTELIEMARAAGVDVVPEEKPEKKKRSKKKRE